MRSGKGSPRLFPPVRLYRPSETNRPPLTNIRHRKHPRHAGPVDPVLIGSAVVTGKPVFPVASMSTPFGRAARVEVGPQVRLRVRRRGPLAELELAELTQRHIQRLIDGLGGLHTGVAPIDWLAEG